MIIFYSLKFPQTKRIIESGSVIINDNDSSMKTLHLHKRSRDVFTFRHIGSKLFSFLPPLLIYPHFASEKRQNVENSKNC